MKEFITGTEMLNGSDAEFFGGQYHKDWIKHITSLEIKINWDYFFGGKSGRTYDRYYKAEIEGIRVEKHASNKGVKYSIGNIDEAKVKFETESELILAVKEILINQKPK